MALRVGRALLHGNAPAAAAAAAASGRKGTPSTLSELQSQYQYTWETPVEFEALDAMQHVNNCTYFRWFESARVRQFSEKIHKDFSFSPVGMKPVVSETWCRFRRSIEMYDHVVVGVRIAGLDQPRGEFKHEYAVWSTKQETVAAVGGCTIVVCDFDNGGRRAVIPDAWLKSLT